MEHLRFDFRHADFDRPTVGQERGRPVARTGLKGARAAVRALVLRFFGFVMSVCRVPVEQIVGDVLGELTGTRCDRVREQNRNA